MGNVHRLYGKFGSQKAITLQITPLILLYTALMVRAFRILLPFFQFSHVLNAKSNYQVY